MGHFLVNIHGIGGHFLGQLVLSFSVMYHMPKEECLKVYETILVKSMLVALSIGIL